jgi:hypothetical protein
VARTRRDSNFPAFAGSIKRESTRAAKPLFFFIFASISAGGEEKEEDVVEEEEDGMVNEESIDVSALDSELFDSIAIDEFKNCVCDSVILSAAAVVAVTVAVALAASLS